MRLSDLERRKSTAPEKLHKLSERDGFSLHAYPKERKLRRRSVNATQQRQTRRRLAALLRVIDG